MLIDGLQDRIDILTDQLNSAIVSTLRLLMIEIDVLQNTIDTLTNDLDELESTLEDKIEDIDGVGAGALGASGTRRDNTTPRIAQCTATTLSYDTSGLINPSTLFAKPPEVWSSGLRVDPGRVTHTLNTTFQVLARHTWFDSISTDIWTQVDYGGQSVYVTRYPGR